MTEKEKLLLYYGEMSGPEAGPWNLGVQNKYLEYRITSWFEENVPVQGTETICNIGIGAGYWDRYLSYLVPKGELISIDIDEEICEMLRLGLQNENNPNPVRIICSDLMKVHDLEESCDIVTMVGSSRMESGLYEEILDQAISFLKPGGIFYYQTISHEESTEIFTEFCKSKGVKIVRKLKEVKYDINAQYYCVRKQHDFNRGNDHETAV